MALIFFDERRQKNHLKRIKAACINKTTLYITDLCNAKTFKVEKSYSSMKVLIPLLSRHEKNEEFLDKAVKGANEVVLLIVIDTDERSKLKAADISSATHFLEEVKKLVGKKRKKCEDLTEWGETRKKIRNTAILNKVDKISLLKQENQWFEEIIKELKEEKEIKNRIQVIEVDLDKPEVENITDFEQGKKTKELSSEKKEIKTKKEKTSEQPKDKNETQKTDYMKETKRIADKILRQGFKSIDSIKKIRFSRNEKEKD